MKHWKFWQTPSAVVDKAISHYSFDRTTPWSTELDYDLSSPYINPASSVRWVPFGTDNLYPYLLLDIYHGSPFHAALIHFKAKAVMADGVYVKFNDPKSLEDKIDLEKVIEKIDRNFFRRFIMEYLIHETVYIEITRVKEKVTGFRIIPAEKIRKNASGSVFYKSYDWRRSKNTEPIPRYDKYNTKDNIQIIEFMNQKPGFDVYAIPEYASANNWIWLDSEIAVFQKQNIEQSINPSAIIKFYKDIANNEEKEQFVSDLRSSFASAKNAGKVLLFFSNGKDAAPDITIAEPNKLDKSFAGAQENIIRNVAYAHMVNPVLMGVATAGKLGASNEINETFDLFKTVWLNNAQDNIEEYLNKLVKIYNPGLSISIKRQDSWVKPSKS